jgi:hypothetical protein
LYGEIFTNLLACASTDEDKTRLREWFDSHVKIISMEVARVKYQGALDEKEYSKYQTKSMYYKIGEEIQAQKAGVVEENIGENDFYRFDRITIFVLKT